MIGLIVGTILGSCIGMFTTCLVVINNDTRVLEEKKKLNKALDKACGKLEQLDERFLSPIYDEKWDKAKWKEWAKNE